ncbi:uncharacterized protein BJX67DRAFT_381171 [Aspergillus lucknowensis]|uniref:DUF7053 domain-containing protein n=1 Tax=Aspergillus lucknowensis TaxID=176173 RepID=A0ABR4LRK3_9EURO
MMRKKDAYTNITPIPACVPRQLALDILHSHGEIITLNPLVLSHRPIKAPQYATADEYYYTWYEITERVQVVPGLGKLGSGKINFKGCFHNVPWGLQTHTYAPMGIDLRNNWRIVGNGPDEPSEVQDPHLQVGLERGLYLREDIEIECNLTLMSLVRAQLKAATKVLVDRLLKKAELLDAGVLQATVEDGKLRTFNPADRSQHSQEQLRQMSQRLSYQIPSSPAGVSRFGSVSSGYSGSQSTHSEQQPYHSYSPPQLEQHYRTIPVELPADNDQNPGKHYNNLPELDSNQNEGLFEQTIAPSTSIIDATESINRTLAQKMCKAIEELASWSKRHELKQMAKEDRPITIGYWRIFGRLSIDSLVSRFMSGIPEDVQTLFEKQTWSAEDFLQLPVTGDDERQGI